ncbi:MAG: beta-galactosidase small subunit family protein, partial [Runella sp.]
YRYVKFTPKDTLLPSTQNITIHNQYDFISLQPFKLVWELLENGKVIQRTESNTLTAKAGEKQTLNIPLSLPTYAASGAEYFLNVSVRLKDKTSWAEAGHEVAYQQFYIKVPASPKTTVSWPATATVRIGLVRGGGIILTNPQFKITFDRQSVGMSSFVYKNRELIGSPLQPNFWRVPTDNDEGGGKESFAAQWRAAGLDSLRRLSGDLRVEQISPTIARVHTQSVWAGKMGVHFLVKTVYTIFGSGDVEVKTRVDANGNNLPPLPKVGMQMQVPAMMRNMRWYGRGPFETYPDRKTAGKIAEYSGKVAEQHFPYIMAQETGNKTDVRWAAVSDSAGTGLLIMANENLLHFNVQDYTDAALLAAKKSQSLSRGDKTVLRIDHQIMGLGGDDSWTPRTHPEYLLTDREYSYTFRLRPFDASQPLESLTQTVLPVVAERSQAMSELGAPANIVKDERTQEEQEAAIEQAEARKYIKRKSTYRRKPASKKRRR